MDDDVDSLHVERNRVSDRFSPTSGGRIARRLLLSISLFLSLTHRISPASRLLLNLL